MRTCALERISYAELHRISDLMFPLKNWLS